MTYKNKIENQNFWRLIFGQSLFTIGNSIFEIILLYTLAENYHANSSILGIFGIIAMIPSMLLTALVPKLATIKNQKLSLILLQFSAILFLIIEVCLLTLKSNLIYIGIFQFLLQFIATVSTSVEIGYIPVILYEDQAEIDKTVNISYVTNSVLTILTGLISSGVIITIGPSLLLLLSILLPFIGLFFYLGINYKTPRQEESDNINNESERQYFSVLKEKFYTYTHTLPTF